MPVRAHKNHEHPHLAGLKALEKNHFSSPAKHWSVLLCPAEGKDQNQPTGLETQRQQQQNSCVFSIRKYWGFPADGGHSAPAPTKKSEASKIYQD